MRCSNQSGALLVMVLAHKGGRDSSVGIATRYGIDGPEFEFPVRTRPSLHVQAGLVFHPFSCTMHSGSLSREVKRTGRGADHPPSSSALILCYRVNFALLPHKTVILVIVFNIVVILVILLERRPNTFGFLGRKIPQHAFLRRGSKAVGPMS